MTKIIIKCIINLSFLLTFLISLNIHRDFAQAGDVLANQPVINNVTLFNNLEDFPQFLVDNILVSIAGVVFICVVLYGGFQYLLAMGNQDKMEKAKKTLLWALIGIALATFGSIIAFWVFESTKYF